MDGMDGICRVGLRCGRGIQPQPSEANRSSAERERQGGTTNGRTRSCVSSPPPMPPQGPGLMSSLPLNLAALLLKLIQQLFAEKSPHGRVEPLSKRMILHE